MLQKDPAHRASLEEIEAHNWLQGLDDALLSPEAPLHWFSGAVSPSSPRAGLPECGDLLAARPSTQQTFPRQCQPKLSFTPHPPPTEEPPVNKNLAGLQLICEEEEEEEDEGVEEKQKDEANVVEMVISNQPVSQTHDVPPSTLTGFGVQCCQGLSNTGGPEERKEKMEPNNNNHELTPVLPESPTSSTAATSVRLNEREAPKTGKQGELDETNESGRDGLKNKKQPTNRRHNEAAPKAENGKRHSIKLRERLFQFPLCEKALAFNIPTHKKPKILPLAQYNCCRVL